MKNEPTELVSAAFSASSALLGASAVASRLLLGSSADLHRKRTQLTPFAAPEGESGASCESAHSDVNYWGPDFPGLTAVWCSAERLDGFGRKSMRIAFAWNGFLTQHLADTEVIRPRGSTMIVAFLGVLTAQTLTVLLSVCFLLLSAAVLVLVLGAIGDQHVHRAAVHTLQPVVATAGVPGLSMRSLIARQTAAPSRAPPTFFPQQRWIESSEISSRE